MDERTQKAFDFASEITKQLLTLSTGIIALTITFLKDYVEKVPPGTKWLSGAAWIMYLFSIICGIWTLMALTGTLQPKPGSDSKASIWGSNVRIPSALQILTFLLGTILTVVFGVFAVQSMP